MLGTSGPSVLGNVIAGKETIGAGKVFIRVGTGSNKDHMVQNI